MIIDNNVVSEKKLFEKEVPNFALLEFLTSSKNLYLYIWSSNTIELIKPILRKYSLLNKFDKIVSRSKVSFLKPNPEGFNNHIYKQGEDKEKYLSIGNSLHDKEAAKRAGIDFYLIDYFKQK